MEKQKSISAILWMGFLGLFLQGWFAFLEGTIVFIAIHGQHYSIYFFGLGLTGLIAMWIAYRWRRTNSSIHGMPLFIHIAQTILAIVTFFIGLFAFIITLLSYEYWS